jgi:hypothetical protein
VEPKPSSPRGRGVASNPANRFTGEGVVAEHLAALFAVSCRRLGLATALPELSTAAFLRPQGEQRRLF